MLMKSDINPFDSQETKPYQKEPRIAAMTDLVDAYQRNDIHQYEKILQTNKDILEDPFIAENIDEVTRNIRMKATLNLIAPYTRFTTNFIAKQLKISNAEVQDIVGFLIIDQKIKGNMDQEKGIVEIDTDPDLDRTQGMSRWTSASRALWSTVLNDAEGFRIDDQSVSFAQSGTSLVGPHMISADGQRSTGGRAVNGSSKHKSTKKGMLR